MQTNHIALDLIDPPTVDDRLERTPETIGNMALSLAAEGQIQEIVIERRGDRYETVSGWTRVLAARKLAWIEIRADVRAALTPTARARIRLAENLQRSNLSPIEEAIRLAHMCEGEQPDHAELATLVHRTPDWVSQRLALLALPDDLQAHVHTRELALGAALALGRCTDPQHRAYLLRYALDAGATVETVRAWVHEWTLHQASGVAGDAPLPPMPVLNQPPTVTMPCARCHAAHDVRESCIIRVCQSCGREIEAELRRPT